MPHIGDLNLAIHTKKSAELLHPRLFCLFPLHEPAGKLLEGCKEAILVRPIC